MPDETQGTQGQQDEDTEAHGFRYGGEPSTAQPETEAHGFRGNFDPAEASDVQAHGMPSEGREAANEGEDDGRDRFATSDARLKQAITGTSGALPALQRFGARA